MNPYHQVRELGQTAEFHCNSSEEVEWKLNGDSLPKNSNTRSNPQTKIYSVIIHDITWDNAGTYECIGRDKDGYFSSEGLLKVVSKSSICFFLYSYVLIIQLSTKTLS